MKKPEEKRKSITHGIVRSASRGLLLAFASGLTFSCTSLLVKYLGNIHPGQLLLYRNWALASLSLPQLILTQEDVLGPPGYRGSVIFRSLVATTFVFLHYIALRYLPLGEASVLLSSSPVFVTLAGKFFLKESFGLLQSVSLLFTVVGMVLTTGLYQTFIANSRIYTVRDAYGFSAALSCIIFATVLFIVTRKLKHVHSSVLLFGSGYVGIVESAVATVFVGGFSLHYKGLQQIFIILLGFLNYLAMVSLIMATQYEEAGPVSTMYTSSDIFFSFVWQVVIFSDVPDGITILGAALVGISVILVGFNKRINNFFQDKCLKL